MYSDQERINRLEHLLRIQQRSNKQLRDVLYRLVGSLAVELGAENAKTILAEVHKLASGDE